MKMDLKKRFTFTRASLRDLPLPEYRWINVYDADLRGLALGVSPTGVKTFMVYRKFKGRPLKIILGAFDPELPERREIPEEAEPLELLGNKASLNVMMARKLTTAVNASLDSAIDPPVSIRKARKELTLGQLFEAYFANLESRGKKSCQQFRWIF